VITAAVGWYCVAAALPPAAPVTTERVDCDAPGCFEMTVSGFQNAHVVAGTATYRTNAVGDLEIVLVSTEPRIAIVLSRYSSGAPSASADFVIDTKRCEDDMDDDIVDPASGSVQLNAIAGTVWQPDWMALGSSGSVRVGTQGNLVAGHFNVKACGAATSKDSPDVAVTLVGSFQARPRQ
jgi:hypothetical protein